MPHWRCQWRLSDGHHVCRPGHLQLAPSVTNGTGTVKSFSGNGKKVVTVNLTGVANAQTIVVSLNLSQGSATGTVSVPMGVLAGDVTADRKVNTTDVKFVKPKIGSAVTASTFRADVIADGVITEADDEFVEQHKGTTIP